MAGIAKPKAKALAKFCSISVIVGTYGGDTASCIHRLRSDISGEILSLKGAYTVSLFMFKMLSYPGSKMPVFLVFCICPVIKGCPPEIISMTP